MNTLRRSAQSAATDIASFQIDLDRPVAALRGRVPCRTVGGGTLVSFRSSEHNDA